MLSNISFVIVCLLWALADSAFLAEVDDENVVKHIVAEAQRVLEEEDAILAKSRFDFNSIPGHPRIVNSERY